MKGKQILFQNHMKHLLKLVFTSLFYVIFISLSVANDSSHHGHLMSDGNHLASFQSNNYSSNQIPHSPATEIAEESEESEEEQVENDQNDFNASDQEIIDVLYLKHYVLHTAATAALLQLTKPKLYIHFHSWKCFLS